MKPDALKDLILSLTQDITFEYDGAYGCKNPWNTHKFEVGYDGKVKTYSNIDELMKDRFYHGKSLSAIAEKMNID